MKDSSSHRYGWLSCPGRRQIHTSRQSASVAAITIRRSRGSATRIAPFSLIADQRGRAVYVCGARTRIVLWRTLSRTFTEPCAPRASAPEQLSWTSHFVPRIVAALYLPVVRKLPLPDPHSRRVFGFLAVA